MHVGHAMIHNMGHNYTEHDELVNYGIGQKILTRVYEAIVKYVIQSPECIKQGLNPISIRFHIFPKIIKEVLFPERSRYHFSQF